MSSDYSVNALDIINSALRVLGVIPSGASAANDADMLANCMQALNLLLKNFQNYGVEQWAIDTYTITNMTAYKASYSFGNGCDVNTVGVPERILQAYVTPQANIDVQTTVISMEEYWELSNKAASGLPNQVGYYFKNHTGTLYVWPVPSVSTYSLTIIFHRPYDDFDTSTDLPDVPQRWFEALKWNLALRLAPEYGRTVTPEIVALATSSIENAIDAGYEEASMFFQPSSRR